MNRRQPDSPSLMSIVIGTLSKELAKAREEAMIHFIDSGYGWFEWRTYSHNPNIVELYGKVKQLDECTILARISYAADFRGGKELNAAVTVNLKPD